MNLTKHAKWWKWNFHLTKKFDCEVTFCTVRKICKWQSFAIKLQNFHSELIFEQFSWLLIVIEVEEDLTSDLSSPTFICSHLWRQELLPTEKLSSMEIIILLWKIIRLAFANDCFTTLSIPLTVCRWFLCFLNELAQLNIIWIMNKKKMKSPLTRANLSSQFYSPHLFATQWSVNSVN